MSNYLKYSVGIDVSKNSYSCCFSVINTEQHVKVKSTRKFNSSDFKSIKAWISKHAKMELPLKITMEATGVYYEQIAWFLFSEGYNVAVVLPNKSKKYLESLGLKSKNDKIDARGLAQMGAEQNLSLWQPVSDKLYELRSLTRNHQSLQALKTVTKNRLHAVSHGRIVNEQVVEQLNASLRLFDKQIEDMKTGIQALIEQDDDLNQRVDNICKIKGLGLISVATIIAETDGFALIKNQRQLVSYAGYDVVENQSGKRVGKTKISKKGNCRIRRVLHMPALNMVTYRQQPFEALFKRVYERTGIKMKGYVAVQKKLLVIIYALWKKNEAFNNQYRASKSNLRPQCRSKQVDKSNTPATSKNKAGSSATELPAQDGFQLDKPAKTLLKCESTKIKEEFG